MDALGEARNRGKMGRGNEVYENLHNVFFYQNLIFSLIIEFQYHLSRMA